jgi:hypothetical protein
MPVRSVDVTGVCIRARTTEIILAVWVYASIFLMSERFALLPNTVDDSEFMSVMNYVQILVFPIYYFVLLAGLWLRHRVTRPWVWWTHLLAQAAILVSGLSLSVLLLDPVTPPLSAPDGWQPYAGGAFAVAGSVACLWMLLRYKGEERRLRRTLSTIAGRPWRTAGRRGSGRFLAISVATLVLYVYITELLGFVTVKVARQINGIAARWQWNWLADLATWWPGYDADHPDKHFLTDIVLDIFLQELPALLLATLAIKLLLKYERKLRPNAHPGGKYLLLRSFADDPSALPNRNPFLWFLPLRKIRLEEALAGALVGAGTLIAIGKPGEKLPRLGADRFYFADHDWQDFVKNAIRQSQAVAMVVGLTVWIKWELQTLIDSETVEHLLAFLPPGESLLQQRWETIAGMLEPTRWGEVAASLDASRLLAASFRPNGDIVAMTSEHRTALAYDLCARYATMMLEPRAAT